MSVAPGRNVASPLGFARRDKKETAKRREGEGAVQTSYSHLL